MKTEVLLGICFLEIYVSTYVVVRFYICINNMSKKERFSSLYSIVNLRSGCILFNIEWNLFNSSFPLIQKMKQSSKKRFQLSLM